MGSEKTQDKRKREPRYRIVIVNSDMCNPETNCGSVFAPGVSQPMSYDEAWSAVRDDIARRVDEGGWGINWAHTEVWDSGDERMLSEGPDDPVYSVRCRVYNLKDDDACGKEPTGGLLAMVYWIMLIDVDGSSGDGLIEDPGYEQGE